jgi:hypothetical protein
MVLHGFELIREQEIPELKSRARIWHHARTGAELLSIENDDENKVFGITFRTPPQDSTGVPHIMEHAVLAGSEKYPLKEPFIELVKGSLATFVNAMTMPDKTMYPAASTNLQDFYNLIDVYVDAVFHPLLTPHHLFQEGWHYELESADAPLTYKGVVFNEMKGAYSSPDNLLDRYSQESLFPDNTYGVDSGGDPTVIPNLTYEQFKGFYDTFYHPSNAFIFFYGDDDPDERLRLMDDYLRPFDHAEIDAGVPLQPRFDAPRRIRRPYSIAADDGAADGGGEESPKTHVQLNWLLPEYADMELVMALEVLSHALLSTPASPLRKALMDSALGEEVIGGGLSTYTRQMTFAAGLKGVAPANSDKVEALILETLARLSNEGLDAEMIEAAVNTIEFRLRENNTGRYPRGLALMFRALGTWSHGRDPLGPLAFEAPLEAVKARLAEDPTFLQALIHELLVDNPHRTTVILEPDPGLAARLEAEEAARLAAARERMSPDDLQAIMAEAETLRERQGTPDPPEVLATLPRLGLEDLDKAHKPIPIAAAGSGSTPVLFHDLFTNGIVYLDLAFDLHALPAEDLPLVDLFGQALVEMGTEKEDFVRLSQRIGRKTGGIYPTTFIAPVRDSDAAAAWLVMRAKATTDQAPEMLAILHDILSGVRLDDRERFRQIVLEAKAGKESSLAPAGHVVVNTRLRAHFHDAHWVEEQVGGVDSLFAIRKLAEDVDRDWPGVLARLEGVRDRLINRATAIANVTLDEAGFSAFGPQLARFLDGLPAGTAAPRAWSRPAYPRREGLAFPAQVNYVGKGADLTRLGYELDGSISVINNLLRTTYLWEKIRLQGGAYGAFCTFSANSGVFTYVSYRDPNLTGSLAAYDGAADFLRGLELSDDELARGIIGAIGALDAYQLPDARGYTSFARHLTGETDERLQQWRDQVLSTGPDDFRRLADALSALNREGDVVVLGSQEALEKANAEGLGMSIRRVL